MGLRPEHVTIDPAGDSHIVDLTEALGGVSYLHLEAPTGERIIVEERGDDRARAERLLERLLGYRVFPDDQDRMNLSVRDINGGVLLVPQFTLAADTRKGARPSFTPAAPPEAGRRWFDFACALDGVEPLPAEAIPVTNTGGRVLAAGVSSPVNVPGFRRAPMDG